MTNIKAKIQHSNTVTVNENCMGSQGLRDRGSSEKTTTMRFVF